MHKSRIEFFSHCFHFVWIVKICLNNGQEFENKRVICGCGEVRLLHCTRSTNKFPCDSSSAHLVTRYSQWSCFNCWCDNKLGFFLPLSLSSIGHSAIRTLFQGKRIFTFEVRRSSCCCALQMKRAQAVARINCTQRRLICSWMSHSVANASLRGHHQPNER